MGQLFRTFQPFRRFLAVLGDLRVPLSRDPLLVRPFLLHQVALEVHLFPLFRVLQAFLLRQPFHYFRPVRSSRLVQPYQADQEDQADQPHQE